MGHTPNPDTVPSAVHADPMARLRAEIREELRAEIRQEVLRSRTVHPPAPQSRLERKIRDHRWSLAGVATVLTAVAAVIAAWRGGTSVTPPPAQPSIETLRRLQRIEETLDVQRINRADHRKFVDGSLCELGVRPSWGCPGLELHPTPLDGEVRILPKLYVPPEPPRLVVPPP